LKKISGLKSRGQKYSIVGKNVGIYVNKLKTRFAAKPTLLTFEGEFRDKFTIEIQARDMIEEDDFEHREAAVGLSNPCLVRSPINIFKDFSFGGAPPIATGLEARITQDYEVLIWHTNIRLARPSDIEINSIPEETLKELRNLGYIQ